VYDGPIWFTTALTVFQILDLYYREAYDGKGFPRYLVNTDNFAYRPNERGTNAFGAWSYADSAFATGKGQDWRGTAHMTPSGVSAATVNGRTGVALFDGINDSLNSVVANYNNVSSGTIAAWVNPSINNADLCIVSSSDTASATRKLYLYVGGASYGNKLAYHQNDNGTADIIYGSTAIPTNAWTHVAYVTSGTNGAMYVNGIVQSITVASGANNGDYFADTSARDNVAIGVVNDNSRDSYMNGSIDEPLIDNSVMTSNQVYQLYLDTKDMFP
jgi:hypothetical protein